MRLESFGGGPGGRAVRAGKTEERGSCEGVESVSDCERLLVVASSTMTQDMPPRPGWPHVVKQ